MSHPLVRFARLSLIVFALLAVSACSSAAGVSSPETPSTGGLPRGVTIHSTFPPTAGNRLPKSPYVHVLSTTLNFGYKNNGVAGISSPVQIESMTQACPPNEVAISGGFQFAQDIQVDAKGLTMAYVTVPAILSLERWLGHHVWACPRRSGNYLRRLPGRSPRPRLHTGKRLLNLPGLQKVSKSSPCPAGTMVIGGGFSTNDPAQVIGDQAYFSPDGSSGWSGQFSSNSRSAQATNPSAIFSVCYGVQRPEQLVSYAEIKVGPTADDLHLFAADLRAICPTDWTLTAGTYSIQNYSDM